MTTDTIDPPPPPVSFLRLPDVLRRVPLGKTAWYAAIKAGDAPAPCKLGGVAMWPEHEIDALAQRLIAARPANPPSGT